MNGLLLKLLADSTGRPRIGFWRLFEPIRRDLDRLAWCFLNQPWMGAPPDFQDDDSATMEFQGEGGTSVQLWRPGSLSRYADHFGEEFIELWGIEPTRDDPAKVVALYNAAPWSESDNIIRQYARVWLNYVDSTCWEIYARKDSLLDHVRRELSGKTWVQVYAARDDRRKEAFRSAGLFDLWKVLDKGGE